MALRRCARGIEREELLGEIVDRLADPFLRPIPVRAAVTRAICSTGTKIRSPPANDNSR